MSRILVANVAVKVVSVNKTLLGVNVTSKSEQLTLPVTGVAFWVNVKFDVPAVVQLIASLNVTVKLVSTFTLS